jgi:hypothetical protein
MEPSAAASSAIAKTENYLYFDPRAAHSRPSAATTKRSAISAHTPGTFPGSQPDSSYTSSYTAPGVSAPGTGASFGQRRQGFNEAVVFVVGGGSMDEFGNLQEWVSRVGDERVKRRVVYGSTEMLSAEDFVREELELLGRDIK